MARAPLCGKDRLRGFVHPRLGAYIECSCRVTESPRRAYRIKEDELLQRITTDPDIFGGKPIVRGRRLAVEHVLGMLAAGDDIGAILEGYPRIEREDVLACLACTSVR